MDRPCPLSVAEPLWAVAQRHGGSGPRGARVARARCLEHFSARATMPAMPHDRSGASLGKSQICDFEIFVVRFAPSCGLSSPIGGTWRFLQNLSKNIRFLSPMQSGNESGGHTVVQGTSPDGPWRQHIHCATVNLENHKNSLKITQNHQNAPKLKIRLCNASKIQF